MQNITNQTINSGVTTFIKSDTIAPTDLHIITGAGKTLVLDTPVWDDMLVPVTATKLGGTKDPQFLVFKTNGAGSQGVFTYWFDAGDEEELYFVLQNSHSWNQTALSPHVHWTPAITADGAPANQKVQWGIEYSWAEIGANFSNTSFVYGTDHLPADANVVAGRHYLTDLTDIAPSAIQDGPSSILVCRLFRNATVGADTYEHDAGLLGVDFHYQKDRIGSRTEYNY